MCAFVFVFKFSHYVKNVKAAGCFYRSSNSNSDSVLQTPSNNSSTVSQDTPVKRPNWKKSTIVPWMGSRTYTRSTPVNETNYNISIVEDGKIAQITQEIGKINVCSFFVFVRKIM